jgi:hypothetical protein
VLNSFLHIHWIPLHIPAKCSLLHTVNRACIVSPSSTQFGEMEKLVPHVPSTRSLLQSISLQKPYA